MSRFKPSNKSLTSVEQSLAALQYAQKAARLVEARLEKREEEVPVWVQQKLREAAQSMGMAVSYLRNEEQRREKK